MQIVHSFSEIEAEFIKRAHHLVLCNCATVDTRNRPRSRILHPIWEGRTGWVTTRGDSLKIKHLAANPFVSLAYIKEPFKPLYVECRAVWNDDLEMRKRIWEKFRNTPEPLGFDPGLTWGDVTDPYNGLLQLTAWRIEINDYTLEPSQIKVWRE
ncbi:pyridoxamine 5'-phosphate oxidase family protein [Chloroflexi bacterium TSY]|nr:pyridoxamine 5'-phosphate oxidase family protein [Chloroflexi bacterium TSY]